MGAIASIAIKGDDIMDSSNENSLMKHLENSSEQELMFEPVKPRVKRWVPMTHNQKCPE
jgi:hypothetical protein